MSKNTRKSPEDEPPAIGEWIVTFSDCMMLLLCFFVLLLTFSSFDEAALKRFGGAFESDFSPSAIAQTKQFRDAMTEPVVHIQDSTKVGSETPTDLDVVKDANRRPESVWIPEDDVYRDKKVIRIPSAKLFEPAQNKLSANGKQYLKLMAMYMRKQPCRVIISENPSRGLIGRRSLRIRTGLARAWAVVDYLTRNQKLSRDQFNVSATHLTGRGKKIRRGGSVEVVLLASKVYR